MKITLGIYNDQQVYRHFTQFESTTVSKIGSILHVSTLASYDVIIVNLVDMTNEQYSRFLYVLRQLNETKVICLHNDFSIEQLKRLMSYGAYDCLTTPLNYSTLKSLLKEAYKEKNQETTLKLKEKQYELRSLRASLAYDLLYGNTKNAKEIWIRSKLANLSLVPNTVLLLSIDHFSKLVTNKGELWKNSIRKEILEAIKNDDSSYESLKVLVKQYQYAILLSLPVQLEEEQYKRLAINYAEKIRDVINEKTNYTVTIGIGNYYEDARNLHLSYEESKYAQTFRFFKKENSIIHISDLDYFATSQYDEYKKKIQILIDKFSIGDLEAVNKLWQKIYESVMTKSNILPEEFRLQILDLIFSLSKSAIKNGANPKQIIPLQIKYAKEVHEIETLLNMSKWIKKIIHEFSNSIKESHNESVLQSVQEVLKFIEENYASDISLEMIAEKVQLSPNYLSAIFKQTVGSSIIEYLTKIRMEKAKEKLQDLSLTIYEIADETGYRSAQYFSRVFKSHFGLTPTQFRKNF